MAAVLAFGPTAVLSHRSAAALWGLRPTARSRIEVTVPNWRRARQAVQVHVASLLPDEATVEKGIPVTTVTRTLLDLASLLDRRQVERAINEAEVRRLADPLSLEDLIARHRRRAGTRVLKHILASGALGEGVTRSELEERFLELVDRAGLPRPELNASVEVAGRWIECDCLWRQRRVVVELDGHAYHRTRAAYERDRVRDRSLQAAGWRVVRVTWRHLHEGRLELVADLQALLG